METDMPITLERRDATAWITLNRPGELNAISPEMLAALMVALDEVEADDALRVIIITGSGRAFSAGADLAFAQTITEDPGPFERFINEIGRVFNRIEAFPIPTIGALNGLTLAGGLELALCCDLLIAAESARIGDAHANFGLLPGAGNSVRLPQRIGLTRAKYLLFTGEFVPAQRMVEAGLVLETVPDEELHGRAQQLADAIAAKSPLGLRTMKSLVNAAIDDTQAVALEAERKALAAHLSSDDLREGLAAFNEKRAPQFG